VSFARHKLGELEILQLISSKFHTCAIHQNDHTNGYYIHTHTTVLQAFSGTTRVSRCQKKASSGPYGARGDIRGKHTNNPTGCHCIRTNQWPISLIPPILHRIPFLLQPSQFILAWQRHQICWLAYPVAWLNGDYTSIERLAWCFMSHSV